ncbi:MAG: long-chain-fatty-acid--CoA ligase [Deltaproteobacteria bacterium]|nr:long-chain-fatty-acid--CoA ligase [Deltaproteobacteria bacterium]
MNTTDFLSIATAICPDREFIVFENGRWTFSQVNERVNRLANALISLGIEKGDRIGMLAVNCRQYVEAYFAAAKIGAVFVPLNFRAKSEELKHMISHAGIRLLFSGSRYLEMVRDMRPKLPSVEHCVSLDAGCEDGVLYENLVEASPTGEPVSEIGDEDVTMLLYTAGTTGNPKAVPLRHSGFVPYVLENVEPANPEIEEKNVLCVPLYHVAGIQALLSSTYGGRSLLLMSQFEVNEWLALVDREKANRAMLVPTMLKWIIDAPDFGKYDLTSLRVITYGAAPMPLEVIKKAIDQMPWVRFINAFGQTETAATITSLGPEDHVIDGDAEEREKKLRRLSSSIGRPLADVEIRIVDDDGNSLPPQEVGEILARGPCIMQGYWRDENKTAQAITPDGWLRTGDKGWRDEDGYVYLAGRGDDMIIRGGENISPEEVENVLYSHPKVDEAAVIGVPDPEWGRQPRAVVVLKNGQTATEAEILEFCKPKLAGFKRPRSVVFVDSLPRNSLGKVLKRKIRTEYGQP